MDHLLGDFNLQYYFWHYDAIKYSKISGSVQLLLSLILPCWAFIFALKRDYLSTGLESNELHFIYSKVMSGDMEAILLVSGFLVLIILAIYNICLFRKHHHSSKA